MHLSRTCEQYREDLLSGEALTSTRRQEVRELITHLEQCADCRRAAEQYEMLQATLSGAGLPPVEDEPAGGFAAFQERLQQAMTADIETPLNPVISARPSPRAWSLWKVAAPVAVAAAAAITAIVFLHAPATATLPIANGHLTDVGMARLTLPEVQQNVEAFDSIAKVFDRRTAWVMLADGGRQSDMGIVQEQVTDQSPLVIRMVLRRAKDLVVADGDVQKAGTPQWTIVSQCDLAIVPGQAAELTVTSLNGRRLNFHVQTQATTQHHLTLMLEIGDFNATPPAPDQTKLAGEPTHTLPADGPSGILATTVDLAFGNSATVGQIATTDGVYSLAVGLDAAPQNPPQPKGGI